MYAETFPGSEMQLGRNLGATFLENGVAQRRARGAAQQLVAQLVAGNIFKGERDAGRE